MQIALDVSVLVYHFLAYHVNVEEFVKEWIDELIDSKKEPTTFV